MVQGPASTISIIVRQVRKGILSNENVDLDGPSFGKVCPYRKPSVGVLVRFKVLVGSLRSFTIIISNLSDHDVFGDGFGI